MQELVDAGAQWVLTTDGGNPVYLTNGEATWRLTPPSSDVVNPIGCGDCLAAGIAVFLDADAVKATTGSRQVPDVVLATRFGMAASAVNLVDLLPARLTLEAAERKLHDVTSDRIA
jgi:fructose-1-phosphate kinase PfkB-like protein